MVPGKLDNDTWIHCEPRLSLGENNTTESFEYVVGRVEWYTAKNKKINQMCQNLSSNLTSLP